MTSTRITQTAMRAAACAIALVFCSAGCGRPSAKKAYAFRGTVEQVDARTKTLSVNGDEIPGWMGAMTMTYKADTDDVFGQVKPGDRIAATVYEGDFQTLYGLHVTPKEGTPVAR